MTDKKIMSLLLLVQGALQTDYESTVECKEAVKHCLNEVDKAAIELSGKSIVVRSKNILESLVNVKYKPLQNAKG